MFRLRNDIHEAMRFYYRFAVTDLIRSQFVPDADNRLAIYKLLYAYEKTAPEGVSYRQNVVNISALLLLMYKNKKIKNRRIL